MEASELTNQYLSGFSEQLKSKGRLPPTIESYKRDANRFLDYLAKCKILPNRVEADTLIEYQAHLRSDCGERENTVRRAVIGIRQFYRYLHEQKIIKSSPFDFVAIPERNEDLPDFNPADIEELIKKTSSRLSTFSEARNAAIVCLIAVEGLKAAEIIGMNWQDVFLDSVTASAVVRGTKARTIRLSELTTKILRTYKNLYAPYLTHPKMIGLSEHRVLLAFKGRDASLLIPHLTRHGLKFIIYELGFSVGMKHLNTEILRHYAVTEMMAAGKSPEEIMDHLGLRRLGNIAKHFSAKRPQSLAAST